MSSLKKNAKWVGKGVWTAVWVGVLLAVGIWLVLPPVTHP